MNGQDPQKVRRLLMAKALGFTESMRQLSPDERQRTVSAVIGEDYNRLRLQTIETFPHLAEILPPAATVVKGNSSYTSESFYMLYIFTEQIYQMLDVEYVEPVNGGA